MSESSISFAKFSMMLPVYYCSFTEPNNTLLHSSCTTRFSFLACMMCQLRLLFSLHQLSYLVRTVNRTTRFVYSVQDAYLVMAKDKFGSRVFESIWEVMPVPTQRQVAETLAKNHQSLSCKRPLNFIFSFFACRPVL